MQVKQWVIVSLLLLIWNIDGISQVMAQSCGYTTQATCESVRGCTWDTSQVLECQSLPVASCISPCTVKTTTSLEKCSDYDTPCPEQCDTVVTSWSSCTTYATEDACENKSDCSWNWKLGCTGSYPTDWGCSGGYFEVSESSCTFVAGGECVGRPCNCDWTGNRCVDENGDITSHTSWSCDGCLIRGEAISICSSSLLGCDNSNYNTTCESVCNKDLLSIDGIRTISLPRCSTENGYPSIVYCNLTPDGNQLAEQQCQYGCLNGLCRSQPTDIEPYCENTSNCSCSGGVCTQETRCWPSYDDYDRCTENVQMGATPACNPYYGYTTEYFTRETCGAPGCMTNTRWCIDDPEHICPPASKPTLRELWLDDCGRIDCKDPSVEPCSGGTPPPPPSGDVPTCTINSITANPTQPVVGEQVVFTANISTTVDAVDYVAFQVINTVGEPLTELIKDSTGADGYTFNYTPPDTNQFRITATGVFSESGTSPCPQFALFTPVRPTVAVNVGVYEVDVNSCTPNGGIAGVEATHNPVDSYPGVTELTGITDANGRIHWPSVVGGGITYTLNVPNISNYTYQGACGSSFSTTNGINTTLIPPLQAQTRNYLIPNNPPDSYTHNFFFTLMAEPWWQVVMGDGYAASVGVTTPPGQTLMQNYGSTTNSSGVLMAADTIDTAAAAVGPDGRLWAAQYSAYTTPPREGFAYFVRSFELGVAPVVDTVDDPGDDGVYYLTGDFTTSSFNLPSTVTDSRTYFITGNLTVDTDIIVSQDGFLAFIVRGDGANPGITIAGNVTQVQGVYITDGSITVANMTDDTIVGINRQFEGQGIFVGWGGVSLLRDLDSADPTDDLANNQDPAHLFIYRPDFLIHAPDGFKHASIQWQEIAPGGQSGAAADPGSTGTGGTGGQTTSTACIDHNGACYPQNYLCTGGAQYADYTCADGGKCMSNDSVCTVPTDNCSDAPAITCGYNTCCEFNSMTNQYELMCEQGDCP